MRTDSDDLAHFCVCPVSGGNLEPILADGVSVGYWCRRSSRVYPVVDGIPLLLPDGSRNHAVEHGLVEAVAKRAGDPDLAKAAADTLAVLETRKGVLSWEWEDEEFWTKEYGHRTEQTERKNWNDRLWEREPLIRAMLRVRSLDGKCIVDVGCGEGQNFQRLLLPHVTSKTVYIATDISIAALKLNRARNPHRRALYLLATADRLPIRPSSVDVMCYFGILHHTERKAATLSQNARLLSEQAAVIVVEALDRPGFGKYLPASMQRATAESAHEERVPEADLIAEIETMGFRLISKDRHHTVFYTLMMSALGRVLLSKRWRFDAMVSIDRLLVALLGRFVSAFRPGLLAGVAIRRGKS